MGRGTGRKRCPPGRELKDELKMVMLGGGGVGKSALTIRFVADHFLEEYDPTIEDSYRKQGMVDDRVHMFDILDTAGEEEFSAMSDQYLQNAQFFFLVFSISSRQSFESDIPYRLEQIRRMKAGSDEEYSIMLVGNKSDLEEDREVSTADGVDFAEQEGIPYVETSALKNEGVTEMYCDMVRFARDGTFPQQIRIKNIKRAR